MAKRMVRSCAVATLGGACEGESAVIVYIEEKADGLDGAGRNRRGHDVALGPEYLLERKETCPNQGALASIEIISIPSSG